MKNLQSSGNSSITPPLSKLTVTIQDQEVPMEVDTGSSVHYRVLLILSKEEDK